MKTYIKKVIFVLPLFIPLAFVFSADNLIKLQSPLQQGLTVGSVLTAFFDILIQIGAVAVTLAIVYAGFMFVVAQGNPEKLNQAKKTLFYTIIGALVLLGAQVIAKVIEFTIKELQ